MALKIFEREGSDGLTLVESMFGTTRGRVTSVVSQPFPTLGTDFLGGILALRREPKSITFHAVHTHSVQTYCSLSFIHLKADKCRRSSKSHVIVSEIHERLPGITNHLAR